MSNLEIFIPAANENMSMKDYADWYKSLGLSPHGLNLKSKGEGAPTGWGKGDHSGTVKEDGNIACRLDDLVDVDVDYHSGGPFMAMLAPTNFIFGRESAKFTHYLFRVEEAAPSKVYSVTDAFAKKYKLEKPDGKPKKTILEIRTGGGFQTVFPPSTHPSNEKIRFETHNGKTFNGDPTTISFQELKRCTAIAAMACVFEIVWKDAGSRHEAALNAAGVLRRYFHATEREALNVLTNIVRCDGDEEPKDRERAIRDTYKVDIKKVAGWTGLKKTFGLEDADVKEFASWAKPDAPVIDFDEVERLKQTYHIVTQGGAAFWRKRMNQDTGRVEWIELSYSDVRIENHMSPAVTAFLKDPTVPRYVNGFHFDPSTKDWKDGGINKWDGWAIEPMAGDWSTIDRHIREVLADNNDEIYRYILGWCAFYVQHPEKRAEVALVFRGAKGTGKGQFIEPLGNLAPASFQHISQSTQVVGRFNDHMHECILFFVDEGFWAGSKEGEGPLKRMITEPTLSIEGKNKKIFNCTNMLHIIMASNEDWVVPATPGERRYAVFDVSAKYKGDKEYFSKLKAAMNGAEMRSFFNALLNLDISTWHPRDSIPKTKALVDQKISSEIGKPEGVLRQWLEAGYLPGTHHVFGDANRLVFAYAAKDCIGGFTTKRLGECLQSRPRTRTRPDRRVLRHN